jgi:D-3-phosphoglycerate dehydrogenase
VYDKYNLAKDDFVKNVAIEELQLYSDIISFHVPYNEETHHYCDASFVNSCAKKPIIINTSRGAILNTLEIIAALENEQLAGCCVDVFEDEPVTKNKIHNFEVYQKLLSRKNVIATPHIAGWTIESKYKLTRILMDKIELMLKGIIPNN